MKTDEEILKELDRLTKEEWQGKLDGYHERAAIRLWKLAQDEKDKEHQEEMLKMMQGTWAKDVRERLWKGKTPKQILEECEKPARSEEFLKWIDDRQMMCKENNTPPNMFREGQDTVFEAVRTQYLATHAEKGKEESAGAKSGSHDSDCLDNTPAPSIPQRTFSEEDVEKVAKWLRQRGLEQRQSQPQNEKGTR